MAAPGGSPGGLLPQPGGGGRGGQGEGGRGRHRARHRGGTPAQGDTEQYSTVQYSSAATHLETGGDSGPQPRLEVVATAGAGCRGWGASSG